MPVTDGLVIGRVKPADLVLADGKVSRQHARVIVESGVVEVEDLDSRNGTRINGQAITRRLLRDGDVLECGGTSMTFRDSEAGPAIGGDEVDELSFEDPQPASPATSTPAPVPPSIDPADDFDEISFDEPASPAPAPAAPRPAADLVEFEDEVVEVRSAPAARPTAAAAMAQRSAAADRGSSGNLLSQDIDQLGGGRRLMINILAVLVALAVGYGAYLLAV